jgi:hypothetical protein
LIVPFLMLNNQDFQDLCVRAMTLVIRYAF